MNQDGSRYAGRGHSNNRGRYPHPADNSTYHPRQAGGEEPFVAGSSNPINGAFRGRGSHQMLRRNPRKQFVEKQASSSEQQWRPVNSKKDASPGVVDLQQEHNSADGMSNTSKQLLGSIASNSDSNHTSKTSEQLLGFIASNSDCNELSPSSAQNVSKSFHSAVERIQIREPTAKGDSCSDSLPYDNCYRSDAVQVPLESFTNMQAGGEEPFVAGSSNPINGAFRGRGSHQMLRRNPRKQFVEKQASSSEQQWRPVNSKKDASPGVVDLQQEHNSADGTSNTSKQLLGSIASNSDSNHTSNTSEQLLGSIASNSDCNELSPSSAQNVSKSLHSAVERIQIREPTAKGESCSDSLPYDNCNRSDAVQVSLESFAKDESSTINLGEINVSDFKDSEDKKPSVNLDPFDICPPKSGVVMLKPSLLAKNRETRNEMKRAMEGNSGSVLRPGMVLLKSSISLRDQVKIVKKCRDLGIGAGGFYQPGYREGGKLHLKMMCLGKNWDPDSSKYGDVRPFDDTKPPGIPDEFYQLVEKAIKDSYAIMGKDSTTKNPERVLPWMNPSICIVNFYSENGRLGLHQDRHESRESLDKGLPVVSFSIGDDADFLFGDNSDTDQAEKVTLKSGDILIFGGKSRHVFHGVTTIHPKTAPSTLLDQTNLRPGRLNLTFRQS